MAVCGLEELMWSIQAFLFQATQAAWVSVHRLDSSPGLTLCFLSATSLATMGNAPLGQQPAAGLSVQNHDPF